MARGERFDFMEREVALRADLSMLDDSDCIWAPVRFIMNGPRTPRPGERVLLVDMNGTGTCIGRVVTVAGWEVCVRPEWETWSGSTLPDRGAGGAPRTRRGRPPSPGPGPGPGATLSV